MNVLLVATYEMGRQPFGLASPAAWLEREGCRVRCLDLAVDELDRGAVLEANLVALHLPMHTATRLAIPVARAIGALNPGAHLCFYGLYAPLNADLLRSLGGRTILGGEFESGLVELARRLRSEPAPARVGQAEPLVALARQQFLVPARGGLPALERYARLQVGPDEGRIVGYTEASRGCRHLCRHCPVVPVYRGRFRIVQADVVLEDVARQVSGGASHITFGDPDFFNGPRHALAVVRALHERFPDLTYDVTIKVEHLLAHRRHLAELRRTGCLFITTAAESLDDRVLQLLDKGHTRADFLEAVRLTREQGLHLVPTFVAFAPWVTRAGYLDLLRTIVELDLVEHVAPVQYAIRLLITASSRLLEIDEVQRVVGTFDAERLAWRWEHPDPGLDRLQREVTRAVHEARHGNDSRADVFRRVWRLALEACDRATAETLELATPAHGAPARATVPYLTEPWYC